MTPDLRWREPMLAALAEARAALADVRAIWGLDAPRPVEIRAEGAEGAPVKALIGVDLERI